MAFILIEDPLLVLGSTTLWLGADLHGADIDRHHILFFAVGIISIIITLAFPEAAAQREDQHTNDQRDNGDADDDHQDGPPGQGLAVNARTVANILRGER